MSTPNSGGPGYVYALINASMPGLVKVGRTERPPSERMADLSRSTGIPTAFELVFDIFVPDAVAAERLLHELLSDRGYRVSSNREFFRAPLREVLELMLHVRDYLPAAPVSRGHAASDHQRAMAMLESESVIEIAPPVLEDRDELFRQAAELVIKGNAGSTSLLQRELKIGYGRAARIIDQLHHAGVVGPPEGSHPREVLVSLRDLADLLDSE